jgi:hypothetical protein
MFRPAALLALAFLFVVPARAGASCLENDFSLSTLQVGTSPAAALDTTDQSNHVAWDLVPGAPGAAVVSCQGYSGSPTPVQRASWGALKTIDRSPR